MIIYPPKKDPLSEVVFFKLSDDEINPLNQEISQIENDINYGNDIELNKIAYNKVLAGHIKHQYTLSQNSIDHIQKILRPAVIQCLLRQRPNCFLTDESLVVAGDPVEKCWVNFQKKHEFNPIHHHSGMFSFVIWIKIPYLKEEENEHENICKKENESQNLNGDFQFITIHNNKVDSIALNVDKKWEKRGVIFPSYLHHIVYPFYTSDEYRISVSGNYWIK